MLLARDLRRPLPGDPPPPGIRAAWVRSKGDRHFRAMLEICREIGLDEGWCGEQFEDGAECVITLTEENRPVGVGLMTDRRCWVEEIGHWLNPGLGASYLYVSYVPPAWRNRHINRLLLAERVRRACELGRYRALAVVGDRNEPSLRGMWANGFQKVGRIWSVRWGELAVVNIRRTSRRLGDAGFEWAGYPRSQWLHIVRT